MKPFYSILLICCLTIIAFTTQTCTKADKGLLTAFTASDTMCPTTSAINFTSSSVYAYRADQVAGGPLVAVQAGGHSGGNATDLGINLVGWSLADLSPGAFELGGGSNRTAWIYWQPTNDASEAEYVSGSNQGQVTVTTLDLENDGTGFMQVSAITATLDNVILYNNAAPFDSICLANFDLMVTE